MPAVVLRQCERVHRPRSSALSILHAFIIRRLVKILHFSAIELWLNFSLGSSRRRLAELSEEVRIKRIRADNASLLPMIKPPLWGLTELALHSHAVRKRKRPDCISNACLVNELEICLKSPESVQVNKISFPLSLVNQSLQLFELHQKSHVKLNGIFWQFQLEFHCAVVTSTAARSMKSHWKNQLITSSAIARKSHGNH